VFLTLLLTAANSLNALLSSFRATFLGRSRCLCTGLNVTVFQRYSPQEIISPDTKGDNRTAAPPPLKQSDIMLVVVHSKLDVLVECDRVYLSGKHWRPEKSR
jgi:hypothetical protein